MPYYETLISGSSSEPKTIEAVDSDVVLHISTEIQDKIRIALSVNNLGKNFEVYDTDCKNNLHPKNNLTFRISSGAFELPENTRKKLDIYGESIVSFYKACDSLFYSDLNQEWKELLSHNRPRWMLEKARNEKNGLSHIFLRPDFILTEDGVVTTEIETSPFGLSLSLFLNKSYQDQNIETIQMKQFLDLFIQEVLENDKRKALCFVITGHTKKYKGQFKYLSKLLKEEGVDASVAMSSDIKSEGGKCFFNEKKVDVIYRCFYLHESVNDKKIYDILQSGSQVFPGYKSHLEEKSLMAMLFDKKLERYFQKTLKDKYSLLKEIFPRTYVLDQNPPDDLKIDSWEDIASISRKKRNFILKSSGFSDISSWAKGVIFLNKLSQKQCRESIISALESDNIFVIQEFKKGKKFEQDYYDFETNSIKTMNGRVRLTPYFSTKSGRLVTAKTTMCQNTDFIHASTHSINSPIK